MLVGVPQAQALSSTAEKMPASSEPPAPEKKKCKACCACPETRKARDECVIEKGEAECQNLIQAHKDCLKSMGFNV